MRKKIPSLGFLFLFALFSSMPSSVFANDNYPNVKTLRTEIMDLIEKPDLSAIEQTEATVRLSFIVNKDKEIVVVDAETNHSYLENYIKGKLNYRLIKTDYVQKNKIYHVKLTFKKDK